MIASLTGKVRSLGPHSVVVEVGGVGMLVQCAPATLARLRVGETGALATSLVVREDSLTLYGFGDDDERVLFELLLSANGVGPKVAQAILATHPAREVRRAIATADHAVLTQVPGIGKKGAERIVIELRDKIGSFADDSSPQLQIAPAAPWHDQLHSALVGLGWSGKEADEALLLVEPQAATAIETDGRVEISVLLRSALRMLGRP